MKIAGHIINGGKLFKPGMEAEYEKHLKGAAVPQRLIEKGIVTLDEGESNEGKEDESLPALGELKDVLAGIEDVDVITDMQSRDKRKKAAPLYKKRLAELED